MKNCKGSLRDPSSCNSHCRSSRSPSSLLGGGTNPSATRPAQRSIRFPSTHCCQPSLISSACAMHRVPSGMLSVSLMLNSPCFVNLQIGAPRNLSSSALISIHGLLPSAAKAFAAFLTIAVFPRWASACLCWSFNTSSVVRAFLFVLISRFLLPIAGQKAAGVLFVPETNLFGAQALDVGDFIAIHFDELRPQFGRRRLRPGGEYLNSGGCHALSAILNRARRRTIEGLGHVIFQSPGLSLSAAGALPFQNDLD